MQVNTNPVTNRLCVHSKVRWCKKTELRYCKISNPTNYAFDARNNENWRICKHFKNYALCTTDRDVCRPPPQKIIIQICEISIYVNFITHKLNPLSLWLHSGTEGSFFDECLCFFALFFSRMAGLRVFLHPWPVVASRTFSPRFTASSASLTELRSWSTYFQCC